MNDVTSKDMLLLAIGACIGFPVGIVASVGASFVLSLLQYLYSDTADRVQKVATATDEIIQKLNSKEAYVGSLRNKYRKSLGVQIDVLAQGFGNTPFEEKGPWPLLTDGKGDRWHNFNEYVEPVIVGLEVYAYITRWLRGFPRLDSLAKLCKQLENVFELLDEAFELKLVEVRKIDGKEGICPVLGKADLPKIQELKEAYRELYKLWQEWLDVCKKQKSWRN